MARPEDIQRLGVLLKLADALSDESCEYDRREDWGAVQYLKSELPVLFSAACYSLGVDASFPMKSLDEIEDFESYRADQDAMLQRIMGRAIVKAGQGNPGDGTAVNDGEDVDKEPAKDWSTASSWEVARHIRKQKKRRNMAKWVLDLVKHQGLSSHHITQRDSSIAKSTAYRIIADAKSKCPGFLPADRKQHPAVRGE